MTSNVPKDNGFQEVTDNNADGEHYESNAHFEPVVNLPLVELVTLEEDEVQIIKLRARLYRFDSSETPSTWKERGTGEIKLLHHQKNNTIRIVMRRDKTLKICANHFVTPTMRLQRPNNNRRNWWMWSTGSDFADEVSKAEIFAIKFSNEENADLWKEKFVEGQNKIQNENNDRSPVDEGDSENSSDTDTLSPSESEEHSEDAVKESVVSSQAESLSESVLKLDLSK